jgi:hypothetical protein
MQPLPYNPREKNIIQTILEGNYAELIRYYGVYASRTKGKSKQEGRFEKFGIKKQTDKQLKESYQPDNTDHYEVSDKASTQVWARLIRKVYEVDPLICPKCSNEMKIVAVIHEKS